MLEFLPHFSGSENQLDVAAFVAVRSDFVAVDAGQYLTPCVVVFGARDPIIAKDSEESRLRKMFVNLSVRNLVCSAHYPQFEQTDEFMRIVSAN